VKLTKEEIASLRAYDFNDNVIEKPNENTIIQGVLLLPSGRKELHESGFPFIRAVGYYRDENKNSHLVDLGDNHDHIGIYENANIDSYGKNIINIHFTNRPKKIGYGKFISCSSLIINKDTIT
jgi:hypothetical protein